MMPPGLGMAHAAPPGLSGGAGGGAGGGVEGPTARLIERRARLHGISRPEPPLSPTVLALLDETLVPTAPELRASARDVATRLVHVVELEEAVLARA